MKSIATFCAVINCFDSKFCFALDTWRCSLLSGLKLYKFLSIQARIRPQRMVLSVSKRLYWLDVMDLCRHFRAALLEIFGCKSLLEGY